MIIKVTPLYNPLCLLCWILKGFFLKIGTCTLATFDGSRTNNFTLIRIFLAWFVLYGHSYAIQNPDGVRDPLNLVFQGSTWIGALSVHGFFAISGYLVCASFARRGFFDYALSRILRIYPALIVCVLIIVFVLGPAATELTLTAYFDSPKTYSYLKNALAFDSMQWLLPGVFEQNKNSAVNGSLWSLTAEVRCYVLLAGLGLLGAFQSKTFTNFLIIALLTFGYFCYSDLPLVGEREKWSGAVTFFIIGVFFYTNREYVHLNVQTALLASLGCYFSFGQPWFDYVFPVTFTYLLFYLAYMTPYLEIDEKLGDISYGLYIYAWPTQQMVAFLLPSMGVIGNIVISSVVTVTLAFTSWKLVESPALALKQRLLEIRGSVT